MKQKISLISFSLSVIGMFLLFIAWRMLGMLLYVHNNVFQWESSNIPTTQLFSVFWIGGGLCVLTTVKDFFLAGRKRTVVNVAFVACMVGLAFYWVHVFSEAANRVIVGPEDSSRITIIQPESESGKKTPY